MKSLFDVGVKVLLATGIIVLFALRSDQQPELVYVDSKKLLLGYKGMEKAKTSFEQKASGFRSKLDTLRTELDQAIALYEKERKRLSTTRQKEREDILRLKEKQFFEYEQYVQQDLKKEDEALTVEVMSKVNDYLKKYGREKGYRIILASTMYGNIAYADQDTDITDDVLTNLNATAK